MRTIKLFFSLAAAFFACTNLPAQVTIGSPDAPRAGALLDLNSGAKGGLLLSNVTLPDLTTIPYGGADAFPGVTSENQKTVKAQFKGAIVYHIGGNDISAGVYVWNGRWWTPADGTPAEGIPVNTVKDAEGNDYTTGYFDDAGWWMTQNLRTTDYAYVDGTETSLVKQDVTMITGSTTEPRYTFPGTGGDATARESALSDEQLEAYGLLYNWVAASGRNNNATNDNTTGHAGFGSIPSGTTYYRGVCPEGWHLPSDYEWNELEKEIATYPQKYSSSDAAAYFAEGATDYGSLYTGMNVWRPDDEGTIDTWWGRQMKSTTSVPSGTSSLSASNSREKGGFDALLVGVVNGSGSASNFSTHAYFWSSSSYNSDGVYRRLYSGYTGVARASIVGSYLFSVRCKKD